MHKLVASSLFNSLIDIRAENHRNVNWLVLY
jgi:hypothetical protein